VPALQVGSPEKYGFKIKYNLKIKISFLKTQIFIIDENQYIAKNIVSTFL
jgi:hypothetical protein